MERRAIPNVIGVDLGTSAVKVLQRFEDGETRKVRVPYTEPLPEGWWNAVCRALCGLDLSRTAAIGLAAQVGTYLIDEKTVIGWDSPAGGAEINRVLEICDFAEIENEISMRHPHIISYPLPRLLYINGTYPGAVSVCQPKEWILKRLTGEYVTDPYSWRGLCRLPDGAYSHRLLKEIGASADLLPTVAAPDTVAGITCRVPCDGGEIPAGIPVYVGLNDFFASLLGMGMGEGMLFDITGTSEHLGVIDDIYHPETQMVSGPWLRGYARYGVTASSGASLDFCKRLDETVYGCGDMASARAVLNRMTEQKPPVFLPYLNGERAPIWNANACGAFFGMDSACDCRSLAYSALEGVCFSLLHIYESLNRPEGAQIRVSGGACVNPLLNLIKAELLNMPVAVLRESDTTALGAAMLAMVGAGWYDNLDSAAQSQCHVREIIPPEGILRKRLMDRYGIYRRLYPALEESMGAWKQL